MTTVRWSARAIRDLERHGDYIADFNPDAAARMTRRLMEAGFGLSTFPKRGAPRMDGLRELSAVYPYVIVYRVDDARDEVTILRVWHGAQRQ